MWKFPVSVFLSLITVVINSFAEGRPFSSEDDSLRQLRNLRQLQQETLLVPHTLSIREASGRYDEIQPLESHRRFGRHDKTKDEIRKKFRTSFQSKATAQEFGPDGEGEEAEPIVTKKLEEQGNKFANFPEEIVRPSSSSSETKKHKHKKSRRSSEDSNESDDGNIKNHRKGVSKVLGFLRLKRATRNRTHKKDRGLPHQRKRGRSSSKNNRKGRILNENEKSKVSLEETESFGKKDKVVSASKPGNEEMVPIIQFVPLVKPVHVSSYKKIFQSKPKKVFIPPDSDDDYEYDSFDLRAARRY